MRLLLKGWSVPQIAQFQERSRQLVLHDVKAVQKRWIDSAVANLNEVKQAQLARLDLIEREAWAAFERSKRPRRATRDRRRVLPTLSSRAFEEALGAVEDAESTDEEDSERVETEHIAREEERDGDPRWLERIAWCVQERNKMFSLYPDKDSGLGRETEPVRRVVVYLPPEAARQTGEHALPQPVELPPARDLNDPSPPDAVQPPVVVDSDNDGEVWHP